MIIYICTILNKINVNLGEDFPWKTVNNNLLKHVLSLDLASPSLNDLVVVQILTIKIIYFHIYLMQNLK